MSLHEYDPDHRTIGLFEAAPYAAAITDPYPAELPSPAAPATGRELVLLSVAMAEQALDSQGAVCYTADGEVDNFPWADKMKATFDGVAEDEEFRL